MARYLLGRLGGILVVFFIVSVVVFLLMHAIPGGPYNEDKVPLSAEAKATYMRTYGLDRPLVEQYLLYMGSALRGAVGELGAVDVLVLMTPELAHDVQAGQQRGRCGHENVLLKRLLKQRLIRTQGFNEG